MTKRFVAIYFVSAIAYAASRKDFSTAFFSLTEPLYYATATAADKPEKAKIIDLWVCCWCSSAFVAFVAISEFPPALFLLVFGPTSATAISLIVASAVFFEKWTRIAVVVLAMIVPTTYFSLRGGADLNNLGRALFYFSLIFGIVAE